MKKKGVSSLQLAEAVDITPVAMSNILTKNSSSIATLERIAEALNVELYELFAPSKNLIRCPRCGCVLEFKECREEERS